MFPPVKGPAEGPNGVIHSRNGMGGPVFVWRNQNAAFTIGEMRKKARKDVHFFLHIKKRKTPIYGTTKATSDFLALVHADNPGMTISQLHRLLTDETKFILEPEAIACLEAYMEAGEQNVIPNWS